MKPELDQEMDSLLRAHGRRALSPRARTPAAQAAAHLDADELSAYAEQALPASVRAHYAAHLADCDDCRRQVVVLVRAAGLAEGREPRVGIAITTAAAPAWRARLAALFAPGAWRYALPVVALLAVSGVAFFVINRSTARREATPAAQIAATSSSPQAPEYSHAETEQTRPQTAARPDLVHNDTNTGSAAKAGAASQATTGDTNAASAPTDLIARNETKVQLPPPVTVTATPTSESIDNISVLRQGTTSNQNAPPSLGAGVGLNNQANVQQSASPGSYAQEPPAAKPAPAGQGLNKEQQARAETARAMAAAEAAADKRNDAQLSTAERDAKREREEARTRGRSDDTVHGPMRSTTAPKSKRVVEKDAPASDEVVSVERRKSEAGDSGATRAVAGRQFRRQKGAWVDTAYRAGQATVNVRRNSEQWRALIADEPELRRIADALGGEVVVVWHGRAYRIKP